MHTAPVCNPFLGLLGLGLLDRGGDGVGVPVLKDQCDDSVTFAGDFWNKILSDLYLHAAFGLGGIFILKPIAKSFKLKKELADKFADTCHRVGVGQAATISQFTEQFIRDNAE